MRFTILFFFVLRIAYSPALAQSFDSIQISLSRKSTDSLIFGQTLAIDGSYKIPEENLMRYPKLADFVLIHPAKLVGPENVLRISSRDDLAQQSPAFRFQRFPYVEQPIDTTPTHDPSNYSNDNGILDGVYIREHIPYQQSDTLRLLVSNPTDWKSVWDGYYVKYNSDPSVTDSLIQLLESDFQNYRTTVVQPVISELLQPFYLSPHEVTNAQYREFVHWVRDSIAFNFLYRELREDEAVLLLNCTKKQRALMNVSNPDSLVVYRARYGFNFDYFREQKIDLYGYDETTYAELIDPYLFYPQAERFYKRREFDISKFVYQSTACSPTPVYPDTLCWLRDSPYPEFGLYTDLYFWHPVYDNYPVVGLTEAQMKAYCDWLQRKKNKELKDAPYTIRVELPQLFHYEMAAKLCALAILRNKIDALAPDPFIINRLREDVPWFITSAFPLTDPEIRYIKTHNPLMLAWYRSNQTFPFTYLNGGVSEYCSESATSTDQMTVLGGNHTIGLVDQHENQFNTIFYQQTVPTDKGSATVGFRPVIYLDWK